MAQRPMAVIQLMQFSPEEFSDYEAQSGRQDENTAVINQDSLGGTIPAQVKSKVDGVFSVKHITPRI